MNWDVAHYKDFPDIKFTHKTTNNIVLGGHPGYLLSGTFRDPTSDTLQKITTIGTILGDKAYSVSFTSSAGGTNYLFYNPIYLQMIKSFEVVPQEVVPKT